MLKVFDEIKGKTNKEIFNTMKTEFKTNPELIKFLALYIENENKIIAPTNILKMMRYYRVEKNNSMDQIEEIGDFAKRRTFILKLRESRKKKTVSIEMKNIKFLIDVYEKLQSEVLHKNQYKILRKCFLIISNNDVKWFTRFLCNKVEVSSVIKTAMLSSSNNLVEEMK